MREGKQEWEAVEAEKVEEVDEVEDKGARRSDPWRAPSRAHPFEPPRKFVAAGPYKFVRNPMYIGGFVALLGFGLYEQSAAILLVTLLWLLLAHLFVILYEEPHLRVTFGAPYDAYCRSVRRWLPRLSPAPKLTPCNRPRFV